MMSLILSQSDFFFGSLIFGSLKLNLLACSRVSLDGENLTCETFYFVPLLLFVEL